MGVFQSTPPRGWRRYGAGCNHEPNKISIHSTARVETSIKGLQRRVRIFQSTPPRGWRRNTVSQSPLALDFNPLHREGGDANFSARLWKQKISIHSTARVETTYALLSSNAFAISIHSTARVETYSRLLLAHGKHDFNPLHREGGDFLSPLVPRDREIFQSTPPRGWRRSTGLPSGQQTWISIHSTARVETSVPQQRSDVMSISIHSTARVETDG